MKASSAIQKGKLLEDYIADQIVAKGIDPKARRQQGSGNGNREKADIVTSMMVLGQNAGIEAKNQKTICIPDWWRQTKKLEQLGREPILAFKLPGEGLEETKVVIYLDTLLELVAKQGEHVAGARKMEGDGGQTREQRYALDDLKRAIAKVQKVYP